MPRIQPLAAPWDPRRMRSRRPIEEAVPATYSWIASLPVDIRPSALLEQFPRIANELAAAPDAHARSTYCDHLLHDRRTGRRGFPLAVHAEIVALRAYLGRGRPASG